MSVYCIVNAQQRLHDRTRKIFLNEPLQYDNALAHSFRLALTEDDGTTPADLSGVGVVANFLRPDNGTVEITTGTITGNIVEVVLPAACYSSPGRYKLTVNLTEGSNDDLTSRTALIVEGVTEKNTSSTPIDPGTIMPSIATLEQEIEDAVASIPADYSTLSAGAVRFDISQSKTATEKTRARTNIAAANVTTESQVTALDVMGNGDLGLDAYGAPFSETSLSLGISKGYGGRVTLNGSRASEGANNTVCVTNGFKSATNDTYTNDFVNASAVLKAGRSYRVYARIISGTATFSTPKCNVCYYIRQGSASCERKNFTSDLASAIAGGTTYWAAQVAYAVDTTVGFGFYLRNSMTFNNMVIEFGIEDLTDIIRGDGVATVEGRTAAADHDAGSLLMFFGKPYQVSAPIAAGDALAGGTNIRTTSIEEQLNQHDGLYTSTYIVQGGFTSADGTVTNSARIRFASPVFVTAGSRVLINIRSELWWDVWELTTPDMTGGNAYYTTNWHQSTDTEYAVRSDCWLMMAFKKTSGDVAPSYFTGTVRIENSGGAITSVYDVQPFSLSQATTKIAEFSSALRTASPMIDTFLFFTDPHMVGYPDWKLYAKEAYLRMGASYVQSGVDFALCGGDITFGGKINDETVAKTWTADQGMNYLVWHDQMCRSIFNNRYYCMVGNHDLNYQSTVANALLTTPNIVNAMYRKEGVCYYSFRSNHCTFYVLDTGLNKTSPTSTDYDVPMDNYKWGQIAWLAQQLQNDKPEHAIIAMHIIRNNNTEQQPVKMPFCLFTNAYALAEAFNSKGTVTLNGETYDFEGYTGKVEMFLGGHLHGDGSNYDASTGHSIPCIMRANMTNGGVTPTFDLVLCDWTNHRVYFKRIGNGNDLTVNLQTGYTDPAPIS